MVQKKNTDKFNLVLLTIALLISVGAVFSGVLINHGYDLEINGISPVLFKAEREVENSIATAKKRNEAADGVKEIYKQDIQINDRIEKQLTNFFEQVIVLRKNHIKIFTPYSSNTTQDNNSVSLSTLDKTKLSVYLTDNQYSLLISMDTQSFVALKENITNIVRNMLEQGIKPDGLEKSLVGVNEILNNLGYSQENKTLCFEIISSFIQPNLYVDEEATQRLKDEKRAEVAPIVFQKGEKIVGEGEVITDEIYEVLNNLGYISKGNIDNYIPIVGGVVLVLIIFIITLFYMNIFHKNIVAHKRDMLLLFCLYSFTIVLSCILNSLHYLLIPILIFTILVSMLMNCYLAIFLNVSITLIIYIINKESLGFLFFFIISGTSSALFAYYTTERNKIFFSGILLSIINVIVIISYTFLFEGNYSKELLNNIYYATFSGLLSVILSVGSLPLWEAVFGIVTPVKLLDLTNPNNALLRRLTLEAPGTYHHSLIVANLSETAAYDIGANPSLARVGGYYHDIGKLKNPLYFAENQMGENPHDYLTPMDSVNYIMSHVEYGLELAEKYKLPQIVKDIIKQHHGTTLIKFFYFKAQKEDENACFSEQDFRYPNEIPNTKESAVVMLADTVEAAVRSMIPMGKTLVEVEGFVKTLIKDKLDDGQLMDSGFTIKDLDTISKSFLRVFKGMYHERIPYPKMSELKTKEK